MPRRNKQTPHVPFIFAQPEASKRSFASKRDAEKSAELQMLRNPSLEIYVYQSEVNNHWFLTRKKPHNLER